jgi:hypothetical protein
MDSFAKLVPELYEIVHRLETQFAEFDRKFTLDGHLVGSIGEVIAAQSYELRLVPSGTKGHDALDLLHRKTIEIKTTQRSSVELRETRVDHLIVLKLRADGSAEEVFNGPWGRAQPAFGERGRNGTRRASIKKLFREQAEVAREDRLPFKTGKAIAQWNPSRG